MKNHIADASGATLSGLCLVHCLALPFLGGILPFAGSLAEDERIHIGILVLAAPVAWVAFIRPLYSGRMRWPLPFLAVTGLVLLGAALFAPHELETLLSVAGGLCLGGAHLLKLRARRGVPHFHLKSWPHPAADLRGLKR
jgi:hypothetical protein